MSSKTSYELPTFGDYTEVRKKEQGTQTAPPAPEYLEKAKTWIVPSSDFFQGVISLAVSIVGATTIVRQQQYLDIVDNDIHFTLEMILQILLAVLTFTLTVTKIVASLCSSRIYTCNGVEIVTSFGLVCMAVLSLVLAILTTKKSMPGILETAYFESATRTFLDYNNTQTQWDLFQINFECCGVSSAIDYADIFIGSDFNVVPESCCNLPLLDSQNIDCSDIAADVSLDDLVANRIYNQGCVAAVISEVTYNFVLAAIAMFALFVVLVNSVIYFSITVSCCIRMAGED